MSYQRYTYLAGRLTPKRKIFLSLRTLLCLLFSVSLFFFIALAYLPYSWAPVNDEVGECDDGVDNDGDGDIDCEDPDCTGDPACPKIPALTPLGTIAMALLITLYGVRGLRRKSA